MCYFWYIISVRVGLKKLHTHIIDNIPPLSAMFSETVALPFICDEIIYFKKMFNLKKDLYTEK